MMTRNKTEFLCARTCKIRPKRRNTSFLRSQQLIDKCEKPIAQNSLNFGHCHETGVVKVPAALEEGEAIGPMSELQRRLL
jgi:hypothetical protein